MFLHVPQISLGSGMPCLAAAPRGAKAQTSPAEDVQVFVGVNR